MFSSMNDEVSRNPYRRTAATLQAVPRFSPFALISGLPPKRVAYSPFTSKATTAVGPVKEAKYLKAPTPQRLPRQWDILDLGPVLTMESSSQTFLRLPKPSTSKDLARSLLSSDGSLRTPRSLTQSENSTRQQS